MTPFSKKLGLKPGQRALILNAPDGYGATFGQEVEGVTLVSTVEHAPVDFVQLFVKDSAELQEWADKAMAAVTPDGLLWICYPKKSSKLKSDLNRDILWAQMQPFKLTGVSLVSIDDTWSAMRFRPEDRVKSARK